MDAVPKGLLEHRGWKEGGNCLQNLRVFPNVSGGVLLGVNPWPFLCLLYPAASYSSSSTCPFPSKISRNRKLSLPFDVQPPSLSEMTEDWDVPSCSSHPLSPSPGVQRHFAASEQDWKCLTSHIIPTVNTHLWTHHLAHTPRSVAISCTSHHAHPKDEHKHIHLFCHTSHHRVEMNSETQGGKNAWSNTQSWASGGYRKTCKCKRREKRTCSTQKSLHPLKCLSSVECKGCQESIVS